MNGIIYKALSGFYYVKTESGYSYQCKGRGKLKKEKIKPLVGDRVEITTISDDEGVIEKVLPRKNLLYRPTVANIDQMIVMVSNEQPKPDYMLMDTLLALAEHYNISALVCVTKIDLGDSVLKYVKDRLQSTNYRVLGISNQPPQGISQLKSLMEDKISCLCGQSGVGKSSLVNNLNPDANFRVGNISTKIQRGKHTTTHSSLVEVTKNGFIVDTPGFSNLSLQDVGLKQLANLYVDFDGFECKFTSCTHMSEQECGVKKAVEKGQLHQDRYESYVMLNKKLKQLKERYKRG
ncbi:ribosome small subunit-dependent GTPase A [Proteinivorax hydrogeniformans]|uniref:Small ribosomal subunit biogenesis GTPase RsgA n=1 Tax=Proteinivorax hydrogeniformans TaxID=1826727 RepID=A0AAU8HX74_9FIRM